MEQLQVILSSFKITLNVPVVFIALYVMVLRSATSLRGALEGVGPENRDFLGPWNCTSEASAILAQKSRYYTVFSVIAQLICCFLIGSIGTLFFFVDVTGSALLCLFPAAAKNGKNPKFLSARPRERCWALRDSNPGLPYKSPEQYITTELCCTLTELLGTLKLLLPRDTTCALTTLISMKNACSEQAFFSLGQK